MQLTRICGYTRKAVGISGCASAVCVCVREVATVEVATVGVATVEVATVGVATVGVATRRRAGGRRGRSGDSGSGGSDSGSERISESDSGVAVAVLISAVYRLETTKSV